MSVYTVIVCRKGKPLSGETYAVEAESCADACQLALGTHALEEHDTLAKFEVLSAIKANYRHALVAEHVRTNHKRETHS